MKNIHFDTTDFDKKFQRLIKTAIPELIEKGMGVAMLDLMGDCNNMIPTVPRKEGTLRGSVSIFVQNKLVSTGEGLPGAKAGKANLDYSAAISFDKYEGVIGYNVPYAAKMHEGIGFKFTEPSSGPKYLESKLLTRRDVYMRDIADTIKAGAK
jgi:hypothetical protein